MSDEQVVDTDGQAMRVGQRIDQPAPGVVVTIDFDERVTVGVNYDEYDAERELRSIDECWPAHPKSWNGPIVCEEVRVVA